MAAVESDSPAVLASEEDYVQVVSKTVNGACQLLTICRCYLVVALDKMKYATTK